MACHTSADNAFGPFIYDRNSADFTLIFEQSILSLAPSALLLCIAPLRAFNVRQRPIKISRHRGLLSKLTVFVLLAAVDLALLILWTQANHQRTVVSVPMAALSLVTSLVLLLLSYLEHTRSVRPSTTINIYLAVSLLLEIPQARTLFIRQSHDTIAALFVTAMALKTCALLLEVHNKRSILLSPYQSLSPEALSSVVNCAFQWWVNPLFVRGFRHMLSMDQLFPPDWNLSAAKLSPESQKIWPQAMKRSEEHPLRRLLCTQMKFEMAWTLVPRVCLIVFKFCQPYLIFRVTSLLSSSGPKHDYDQFLVLATALIYVGLAVCTSLYKVQMNRLKSMTRSILVSLIFDKALDNTDTSNKAALTLMTSDTAKITNYFDTLIDGVFGSFIEVVVALVLLERQIGWVCIVPILLCGLAWVWGLLNKGSAAPLQRAWANASQARISYTAKILGIHKAVKMLGLSDIVGQRIRDLRYEETERSRPMTRFGVTRNVIGSAPHLFAPPATLAVAVLVKGHGYLNVDQAFTTLSIIALLTMPVNSLVNAIPVLGSAAAILDRIENFVAKAEHSRLIESEDHSISPVEPVRHDIKLQRISQSLGGAHVLKIANASFGYKPGEAVLSGVNIKIAKGTLNFIYGSVGTGKSTLLRGIVGDLKPHSGMFKQTVPNFAYCSQEAWIPNMKVKDIITMGSSHDQEWYDTVVESCCLVRDIDRMPDEHDTMVGSKGIQLSGGQRQRISLARALFARKTILVVDDVLSGLDASTSGKVFDRVFGNEGICRKSGMTVIFATHNKRLAANADHIVMLGPDHCIVRQGTYAAINDLIQAAELAVYDSEDDKDQMAETKPIARAKAMPSDTETDLKRKTGDFGLYVFLLDNIGIIPGLLFIIPACLYTFCLGFPSVWLEWWANAATKATDKDGVYIGLYFVFAVGALVLGGVGSMQFTSVLTPVAGRNLHRQLLEAVLKTPYYQLAAIDTGTLLNRFSQDMMMVDVHLSGAAYMSSLYVLQAIVEGALIVAGSVYLTAVIPAVIAILYVIQSLYLRTSRQLRFLDLEGQAPLQTHFLESIDGLSTIRAFGWQDLERAKNLGLLDMSQRPFYLLLCCQVWLGLVLDLVATGMAILVVAVALNSKYDTTAGSVGVALISVLSFSGTLSNLIKAWTQMETSLGAVSRVRDLKASTIPEDGHDQMMSTPADWPTGRLSFKNLTAGYKEDADPVVVNFDLEITAGEKIGICGRSGSGKSSVLLALFRMLQITSGSVSVDGVDITAIRSEQVRSCMSVVPQEPVSFPGSVRFNVDPYCVASNEQIVGVLQKVGLWAVLQDREGGLDAPLESTSLSTGQQQLLTLARALLRKTKIMVLDEATSSVDTDTESKMIDLVKDECREATVIAVAHRLRTIAGFDRVLVMDNGRVVEIGSPRALLKQKDSRFHAMFRRSGHDETLVG